MGPNVNPSSAASHEMVCEAQTPAEALFVCVDEVCGRRVVVGKSPARLTVIDRGEFWVRHAGSAGGLCMNDLVLA